jgi:hypothetical protein
MYLYACYIRRLANNNLTGAIPGSLNSMTAAATFTLHGNDLCRLHAENDPIGASDQAALKCSKHAFCWLYLDAFVLPIQQHTNK